jgi:hypothetical protein
MRETCPRDRRCPSAGNLRLLARRMIAGLAARRELREPPTTVEPAHEGEARPLRAGEPDRHIPLPDLGECLRGPASGRNVRICLVLPALVHGGPPLHTGRKYPAAQHSVPDEPAANARIIAALGYRERCRTLLAGKRLAAAEAIAPGARAARGRRAEAAPRQLVYLPFTFVSPAVNLRWYNFSVGWRLARPSVCRDALEEW